MNHHISSNLKLNVHDINSLCQHYLAILYQDVKQTKVRNNMNEIYGEILSPGIDKILSEIKLSNKDIFVDYGSGLGKMVIDVFLKSKIKEAYGIEILPDLHQYALNASQKIKQDLPEFFEEHRRLEFIKGNFLEVSFISVTIALIVSTCFTQSLLNTLGNLLKTTPSVHTVLSLRPISTLHRLPFKKAIRIECSWDSALCYIYSSR